MRRDERLAKFKEELIAFCAARGARLTGSDEWGDDPIMVVWDGEAPLVSVDTAFNLVDGSEEKNAEWRARQEAEKLRYAALQRIIEDGAEFQANFYHEVNARHNELLVDRIQKLLEAQDANS